MQHNPQLPVVSTAGGKCRAILVMRHHLLWFLYADERRGGVLPLASVWSWTFFYFTVRADCSVTGCLRAISIIMRERDRDPFLPAALPPHTASQRDDTSPPARLPAPSTPPPHPPRLLFAGSPCFFPRWWCFFFVIPTISVAHSRSVFFPRVPRLADSPTRLLHQRAVGWGQARRGGRAQMDVWGLYI